MTSSLDRITVSLPVRQDICLTNILHTDRVRVLHLVTNPGIYATTLIPHPYTPDHLDQYYDALAFLYANAPTCLLWAIRDTSHGDRFIGSVGLHPPATGVFKDFSLSGNNAYYGLGCYLDPEYWGRGIMGACVRTVIEEVGWRELGLDRVRSEVFAGNEASLRIHVRLGFKEIARIEKKYNRCGKDIDVVEMELLRKRD